MSGPEQQPSTPEKVETSKVSAEQYELLNSAEAPEISKESTEKKVEKARAEVEQAISKERPSTVEKERKPSAATKRRGAISRQEKEASYKRHMKQVQDELPPLQRAFSKFIHAKPIEKASELIGSTVARPNAILFGAIAGFVLVLAVYLIAKNLGYVLSGFETIGAFIAGWILGVLYDFFRTMITGKKS